MPIPEGVVLKLQRELSKRFSRHPDVMQQIQLEVHEIVHALESGHPDEWVKFLVPWATQRGRTLVSTDRQRRTKTVTLSPTGFDEDLGRDPTHLGFGTAHSRSRVLRTLQVAPSQENHVYLAELHEQFGPAACLVGKAGLSPTDRGRLMRKRQEIIALEEVH